MNMYNERIGDIRCGLESQLDEDTFSAFESLSLEVNNFANLRSILFEDRRQIQHIIDTIEAAWIDELHDEGVD